jgi:predicted ATPase/DNA-binding winged helix-turn-helix (wHTH) protein/tetratricopeptide (TPR) repeat protein
MQQVTQASRPKTYRFGSFTLSLDRHELSRDGVPVELGVRAFDLLACLVLRAGQVLSQTTLIVAIWGGRTIEQNNLTVQMSALRRALGADTAHGPFIRTVPGQGYVFVADVIEVSPHDKPAADAAPVLTEPPLSRLAQAAKSFIGREVELTELRLRLRQHRLVTIAGIGGIGKTRMALQVGGELAASFGDGARVVDLAPISDAQWLAQGLATAVTAGAGAVPAEVALVAALRSRRMLLILDNAEHLRRPLARLLCLVLEQCPDVSVLVTSRESLGVDWENVFRLQPLTAPPAAAQTAEALLGYDAVRLFAERAAATVPGFVFNDATSQAVADICRRLDGIALAIEMAVPRLHVLTPRQIADRLGERFRLLAPLDRSTLPRQQTLRGMFDWSWELLDDGERPLLQLLALFAGSASLHALVTLSAAAGVSEWDVLDHLTGLVEKSLVVSDMTGVAPRYRVLETTRFYALERLGPAVQSLRRDYCVYVAELFEQAETEWPITRDTLWVERYGPDADNMRAALEWAFGEGGDQELGLRLAAASWPLWWDLPGLPLREGRHWLDLAVNHIGPETPKRVAARLWFGHSWRDARFGDTENFPAASRAVALFRELGDPVGLGASLWRAGQTMLTHETADAADRYLAEAATVLRTRPSTKFLALCLVKQADLLLRQNRLDESYERYDEAMRIIRSIGHRYGLSTCASNMADLLRMRGEPERALRQLADTRSELPRELRSPHVATFAAHLALSGDWEAAYEAAREVTLLAPATGLSGALGWIAETLALLRIEAGDLACAARLAGFARRVHPSTATRAGARREVFLRVDAALGAMLAPIERARLEREGADWTDTAAADAAAAAANRGEYSEASLPLSIWPNL